MPKHRVTPKHLTEATAREAMIRHGLSPLDEMCAKYNEWFPWPLLAKPDGGDGEKEDENMIAALIGAGYIPKNDPKHGKILVLGPKLCIGILSELAQYIAPKLRGQEIRGQVDHQINITIKSFELPRGSVKQIEAPRPITLDAVSVEKVDDPD